MPRDISGNYTLPVGNPVVDGTIIAVGWANPTMSDIATQLNNVVTRDGILSPTAPILFATGSAAAPSIAFSADPALGLYRAGSNILGFATGGAVRGTISATGGWTLGPPSSAVALVVNAASGEDAASFTGSFNDRIGIGIENNTSGTAALAEVIVSSVTNGLKLTAYSDAHATRPSASWLNTTTDKLVLGTVDSARLTIGIAGNVTIAAPSSGDWLTLAGAGATINFSDTGASVQQINMRSSTFNELVSRTAGGGWKLYTGAGVLSTTWSAAGNVTIAAPAAAATTLILGVNAANAGISIVGNAATSLPGMTFSGTTTGGSYSQYSNTGGSFLLGIDNSAGGLFIGGSTAYSAVLTTFTATGMLFGTNSLPRMSISSAGNVAIAAPSSGVGLTQTGFAGSDTAIFNGGTSGSFRVTDRGLPYGTSIHNNAGAVTGTTNQYITSGDYTPTSASPVNCTVGTVRPAVWSRLGNHVRVSGAVNFSITAAGVWSFTLTLPFNPNLTQVYQLGGVLVPATNFLRILGSGGNLASFTGTAAGGVISGEYSYLFDFQVIS